MASRERFRLEARRKSTVDAGSQLPLEFKGGWNLRLVPQEELPVRLANRIAHFDMLPDLQDANDSFSLVHSQFRTARKPLKTVWFHSSNG